MADAVTVTEAAIPASLDRLLQFYLYDFSEYAPLHGEVDDNGQFACHWLDSYWQEADRVPLLIRADGRIAGFALLNQWSALDRPVDRPVAEFFVLRKYRRARVGTRAAHLVFHRYPGRWEVPVTDHNREALLFWSSLVRSAGLPKSLSMLCPSVHPRAGARGATAAPGRGGGLHPGVRGRDAHQELRAAGLRALLFAVQATSSVWCVMDRLGHLSTDSHPD